MLTSTDSLHATPVFVAVAAIFQNANSADNTPDAGNRVDLDREAAQLCRRAAHDLERRA